MALNRLGLVEHNKDPVCPELDVSPGEVVPWTEALTSSGGDEGGQAREGEPEGEVEATPTRAPAGGGKESGEQG